MSTHGILGGSISIKLHLPPRLCPRSKWKIVAWELEACSPSLRCFNPLSQLIERNGGGVRRRKYVRRELTQIEFGGQFRLDCPRDLNGIRDDSASMTSARGWHLTKSMYSNKAL